MRQQPLADLLPVAVRDEQVDAAISGSLRRSIESCCDRTDKNAELANRGGCAQRVTTCRPAVSEQRFQAVRGPDAELISGARHEFGLGRHEPHLEFIAGTRALQEQRGVVVLTTPRLAASWSAVMCGCWERSNRKLTWPTA